MTYNKNIKKILIFSVAYYPRFVGGDEVAVKEITDRLDPAEYEFHLITLRFDKNLSKEERIGNVFIHRLGFVGEVKESADSVRFPLHYNKYLYPFIGVWKARELSKKHNFLFVWSIMANYAGFAALFFKLLRPKTHFVLNLQEGDPFEHYKRRVGLLHPLHKMIFKKADTVTALSNYLVKWAKDMGFKGEPVIVPNGVHVEEFSRGISKEEKIKIREKLGLKEEDVALVTTSRLVIKNGVGDVIKSLTSLPSNVKFVIFGEGYLEEKLKLEVRNSKLETRVIFRGFLDHKEMPKYLKACDIFIRPSLSEGFGNSFIEAMASGLAVIATPVGGIVDFLRDGETGYFCKPEDPENIAETVKRVVTDPNKNQIIENAKRMVAEKYDWDQISLKMKEIFDTVQLS